MVHRPRLDLDGFNQLSTRGAARSNVYNVTSSNNG